MIYRTTYNCMAPLAVMLALSTFSTLCAQPTLISHWTFDEGLFNDYDLTSADDNAGGNNNATFVGDANRLTFDVGLMGGTARIESSGNNTNSFFDIGAIDQLDGLVVVPASGPLVLGAGITISAWINPQEAFIDNTGIMIGRNVADVTAGGNESGQLWGLLLNQDGSNGVDSLQSRVSSEGISSAGGSILDDTWHHVAMVWGNSKDNIGNPDHLLFIDGVEVVTTERAVFEIFDSGTWTIGEDPCCNNREFDGFIDDVALFNGAMTDVEVQALYNNGLNGIDAAGVITHVPGDVDGLDANGLVPAIGSPPEVSLLDFQIILDNLGQDAMSLRDGDLNADRRVDLNDFQEWLENSPPALHAAAFAALSGTNVPEPSSIALVSGLLAAAGLVLRSRNR